MGGGALKGIKGPPTPPKKMAKEELRGRLPSYLPTQGGKERRRRRRRRKKKRGLEAESKSL